MIANAITLLTLVGLLFVISLLFAVIWYWGNIQKSEWDELVKGKEEYNREHNHYPRHQEIWKKIESMRGEP